MCMFRQTLLLLLLVSIMFEGFVLYCICEGFDKIIEMISILIMRFLFDQGMLEEVYPTFYGKSFKFIFFKL